MSLSERILFALENGEWCLQDIAPSFRRRLADGLQIDPLAKSISALCMGYYGKVNPNNILLPHLSRAIDPNQLSVDARMLIESTFVSDYENSSVCAFETETREKLEEAMAIVEQANQGLATLRESNITGFIRVAGVNFRSASHPHIFGLILLGDGVLEQSTPQLAVSVVHEMAHQELFLVNLLDRLVNEPWDYNQVHAPFQGTKRPPIGRLHSLWALYRMVQFQRSIGNINQKHQDLLRQNVEAFEDQELTSFAKKLVEIAGRQAS
jgi:hypothetical protein